MGSRVYREACGPGCDFVAGPSRDQNLVMRIVDAHRATEHVLHVPAEELERRGACTCARCLQERAQRWDGGLVGRRRARGQAKRRRDALDRRRAAAATLAQVAVVAWSSGRVCPICRGTFTARTARHTFCSSACQKKSARLRESGRMAPPVVAIPPPIRHGTEWGYKQHRARGQAACDVCRRAYLVGKQERARRRARGGPSARRDRQTHESPPSTSRRGRGRGRRVRGGS